MKGCARWVWEERALQSGVEHYLMGSRKMVNRVIVFFALSHPFKEPLFCYFPISNTIDSFFCLRTWYPNDYSHSPSLKLVLYWSFLTIIIFNHNNFFFILKKKENPGLWQRSFSEVWTFPLWLISSYWCANPDAELGRDSHCSLCEPTPTHHCWKPSPQVKDTLAHIKG